MIIMKGKEVANKLEQQIDKKLSILKKHEITPKLAIIRVGDNADAIAYENSAKKNLKKYDIEIDTYTYVADIKEEEFLIEFEKINTSEKIHGILLLRPLPKHINLKKLSEMINPSKDVDGMSAINLGKIILADGSGLLPSTPAGVMEILAFYEIDVEGKDVVIIGHSEVVGKPLDILLLNQNATVTVCHIYSKNIKEKCQKADIVISATGKANLVTADFIKEDAIVIDVGISYKDGKITGDVDYDAVSKKASYITPVPGGVGAVTTTMLAKNVLTATELSLKKQ